MVFLDRRDAGRRLSKKLQKYKEQRVLVLGLPRGGVVVADEIAKALGADLDVLVARKIGAPQNPELAIGAVTVDGAVLLEETILSFMNVPDHYISAQAQRQKKEIERQLQEYRGKAEPQSFAGRTLIIVDDGVATGMTMKAALKSVAADTPAKLVLALPVAPQDTTKQLTRLVDELVILHTPEPFYSVGQWYAQFEQVSDEQVLEILRPHMRRYSRTE